MQTITIKHGDSFSFSNAITDDSGSAITGMSANLKCQIRDRAGTLIEEMMITESDTAGTYLFRSTTDSNNWPDFAYFDIQLTQDGIVKSTDTFCLALRKDVTE